MSQKNLPQNKSYTRKKIQNYSYGLNDTIGKGYSSQVYKGRNDNTQQPVAVKVIDLKMLKNEINKTLLASQIQILKSMKNVPYILTLHEVYTTKNNTYIITELCQTDLSSKIKKGLTETECFIFMSQIIQGYSYIHEKNLIHRDLKPANLLITKKDQIKIADFGFGVKAEQVLKPSKYNVGSPLYMAPESLKKNQYSYKTDIWALGIIFFQMLTGDTPWRAKNQKQLIKKIESETIQQILSRQKFAQIAKQFLSRALNQDKNQRLGPDQLLKYNFRVQQYNGILGQKQLNSSTKLNRFQSIINQASSPKGFNCIDKSIQKRIFTHQKSQKKLLQQKNFNVSNQNIQNMSFKNIQNLGKNQVTASIDNITTTTNTESISKEDKKFISKLLIAEVHFCRFLYKLLGRIKQSMVHGLLKDHTRTFNLFQTFSKIIQMKITRLKQFELQCFLEIQNPKYEEYKRTSDFKKLIKISKDYFQRYSTQLSLYWEGNQAKPTKNNSFYKQSTQQVTKSIQFLLQNLQQKCSQSNSKFEQAKQFVQKNNKDIIILDYLITCKQLLQMIQKQIRINGCQNFQKFAKKSRIQEIVQGSTTQISMDLYNKISQRARIVIGARRDYTQY